MNNLKVPAQDNSVVMVAVMGATGTGQSTFIRLLTKDDKIQIGNHPESETSNVAMAQYIDQKTGRTVALIDTPGFDDSREDITDTDILGKIVGFLEPAKRNTRKLNGIIYLHRISDPRVGGLARKNLRMLQALCGDANLDHVRIVTTNWNRVSEQQANERQGALERGAFKFLIDAGARVRRHADTIESAQRIISELISLPPVTMQIQEELRAGEMLADTSAGVILTAEMREAQKKHEKEMADLKREMEEAAEANDAVLGAELEQDRNELELKMRRIQDDRRRLENTLEHAHSHSAAEQGQEDTGVALEIRAWPDFEPRGTVAETILARLVALKRALFG